MTDRIDVAIVGGGLAGLAAAVKLAEAGVGVRLYDRGSFQGRPGGGVVSDATLAPLGGPSVRREVPVDRDLAGHRWQLLTEEGDVALDFLDSAPPLPSEGLHTVRTATLAPFLSERATMLGADLRGRSPISALLTDPRGRVTGVSTPGGPVEAKLTILADGGGLEAPRKRPAPPGRVAVAESFWTLPESTITGRFGDRKGKVTVTEILLGGLSPDHPAGGYLLPFRSSVAVGVLAPIPPEGRPIDLGLLARLEAHPSVAPLLKGGTRETPHRVELPDDPMRGRPLSGPGFLRIGTAGGLWAAGGARFRCVDAALRSGQVAAEVARDAVAAGEVSALRLRSYRLHLRAHGLIDELRKVQASGRRYRSAPGVARDLPRLLHGMMHELMSETGGPKRRILATVRESRRRQKVSRRTLLRAALVAGRWS